MRLLSSSSIYKTLLGIVIVTFHPHPETITTQPYLLRDSYLLILILCVVADPLNLKHAALSMEKGFSGTVLCQQSSNLRKHHTNA